MVGVQGIEPCPLVPKTSILPIYYTPRCFSLPTFFRAAENRTRIAPTPWAYTTTVLQPAPVNESWPGLAF